MLSLKWWLLMQIIQLLEISFRILKFIMSGSRIGIASYGPIEDDLLYLQDIHRSNSVYLGGIDDIIRARHNNSSGFNHEEIDDRQIILNERVVEMLHDMGFFGVYSCGFIELDAHLITALLERWRPETHTFHFPFGEAMITLEDVAVLWGLPVRGEPIIGADTYPAEYGSWRQYCDDMFGFSPNPSQIRGSRIRWTALKGHLFENLVDDESSVEEVLQYARTAVLLLIGTLMCPDTSGNLVSLLYLRHMRTVDECRNHNWGSAVLAFLYRELCGGSYSCHPYQNIGGALQLMQIWAMIRIKSIRPQRRVQRARLEPTILANGRVLPIPPHVARWSSYFSWTQTASHSVRIFREIFDRLTPTEFTWRPYNMDWPEIVVLPAECGVEMWHCNCPLIHYNIIENLYIDRVTRQFGIIQVIPPNPSAQEQQHLHKLTRQGRPRQNWAQFHARYIAKWYNAVGNEIDGDAVTQSNEVAEGYYDWFLRKTRKRVSPPLPINNSGYKPDDPEVFVSMMNVVTLMMDNFLTISDYANEDRFKELAAKHKEVLRSLQDTILRREFNIHGVSTSGTHGHQSQVPAVSQSFQQWDTSAHLPHQSPYAPSEGAGPSTPYVPHFTPSFNDVNNAQTIYFNQPTTQYQPVFAYSPIPFELSDTLTPEARPPLRRSNREPRPRYCFTGGRYGHHDHR